MEPLLCPQIMECIILGSHLPLIFCFKTFIVYNNILGKVIVGLSRLPKQKGSDENSLPNKQHCSRPAHYTLAADFQGAGSKTSKWQPILQWRSFLFSLIVSNQGRVSVQMVLPQNCINNFVMSSLHFCLKCLLRYRKWSFYPPQALSLIPRSLFMRKFSAYFFN